jgi:ATP-dependent Clp protease ATP-binding subunit ClpC
MSTSQLVLLSSSSHKIYTAQWLSYPQVKSLGSTPAVAKKRLEEKIEDLLEKCPWYELGDWSDASIFTKIFPLQTSRQVDKRRVMVGQPVDVPIRYIRLEKIDGQKSCYLPELNVWTEWSSEGDLPPPELETAVNHRGLYITPEKLALWWPPLMSEVDRINIRTKKKAKSYVKPSDPFLEMIADPITRKMVPFMPPDVRATLPLRELIEFVRAGGGVVVGEPGCGKTSIINSVAVELDAQHRAENKRNPVSQRVTVYPRYWRTNVHRLISGMNYLGMWQQRIEQLIQSLANIEGFLILDNLRDLARQGGNSPRDSIAAFLIPYVRSGQLRLVVESTPRELDAMQQMVPGLVAALSIYRLNPRTHESEELLIQRLTQQRLSDRKVNFDPQLPKTIQRLCRQFHPASAPPSATVRFTEALTEKFLRNNNQGELSVSHAITEFSELYGLPEVLLKDEIPLNRPGVVESFKTQVIGQARACETVASVFSQIKTSLNDPGRPFANMFFCGPTGVGKTQLAKTLARTLFGQYQQKSPLVRIDMSEYSYPGSGGLFLQNPDGSQSAWLQQIRNRPLSVLLLDEIEKASSDVFDVLLSLLDEGRLTDSYGMTTSFRTCVIIMTSNIGVRRGSSLGFGDGLDVDFVAEVRKAFRPEFFNRLDYVIPFSNLSHDVIQLIAAKELRDLNLREGLRMRGIRLEWTQRVLETIARVGFDPDLGARPLQKAIEVNLVAPLSRWLLDHPKVEQNTLFLDWRENCLSIDQRPSN